MVDYTDLTNLKTKQIDTAKYLHDGGFDAPGRYFMTAANASDKIVVIDTKESKLEAIVDVGKIPHPGAVPTSSTPNLARCGQRPTWVTRAFA